jgi:hypothetical protein
VPRQAGQDAEVAAAHPVMFGEARDADVIALGGATGDSVDAVDLVPLRTPDRRLDALLAEE